SESDIHPTNSKPAHQARQVRRGGYGWERLGGPVWASAVPHSSHFQHKQFPPATAVYLAHSGFLYPSHSHSVAHSTDSSPAESNASQTRAKDDHAYQSAFPVRHQPHQ